MITFFILALAATAFFFAAVPVVLFALMLETCEQRGAEVCSQSLKRRELRYKVASTRTKGAAHRIASAVAAAGALLAGLASCSSTEATEGPVTFERTGTVTQSLSSCIDVPIVGDAMLSNPPMVGNFGTQPILRAGGKDESLVRFDVASIPASAVIDSATLKLYVSGSGSDAPVNVHRATATWSESSVTYASFGQHFDLTVLGSVVVTNPNVQKSVDLTPLVASWVTGAQPNFGVLLEANSTSKKTIFVSREGGTAEQKPVLQICYMVPDDHCSANPCQNGGTCENETSGFACHCAAGFKGASCETNVNDCANSPCLNGGACSDGVNGYSCACAPGFAGANCETNIDDCAPNPCQNGGVCADGIASYSCACPPGYSGTNCETLIDNCAAQPCQNGAACTNGVNSYVCTCAPGFTGTNCEINVDDCANGPCHNGGTCIDGVNAYTCACPPDWGGSACDVNLNTCAQHPCLNGASCVNGGGTYACTCAPGYSGTNCEVDINDCADSPCHNGGVCVDGVNSFTCTCAGGFSGTDCQVPPELVASGVTFRATQGMQVGGLVAEFVDATTDYYWLFNSTIDWGDGTPIETASNLGVDPGRYLVVGEFTRHVYAMPGTFAVTVSITHATTGATSVAQSTAIVGPELTAYPVTFTAMAGDLVAGTVAGVFDARWFDGFADHEATVDWGDGDLTIQHSTYEQGLRDYALGNRFIVDARGVPFAHKYTRPGTFAVTVYITNTRSGATAVAHSTAVVTTAPADSNLYGETFRAAKTVPFQGFVASLTGVPNEFLGFGAGPSIDWGDGTAIDYFSTIGFDGSGGNNWVIHPAISHVYTNSGTFDVTVSFPAFDGRLLIAHSTALVADELSSYGMTFNATKAVPFRGPVASVTHPELFDVSSLGLSATIDWGDGSAIDLRGFPSGSKGNFVIGPEDSHVYASSGTFNVTVTVTAASGTTTVARSTALVSG